MDRITRDQHGFDLCCASNIASAQECGEHHVQLQPREGGGGLVDNRSPEDAGKQGAHVSL